VNPFKPLCVISEDEVAHLHRAALELLANSGIRVLLPEARSYLKRAGAAVDGSDGMVRFDSEQVTAALATAPTSFDVVPTGPDRVASFGANNVVVSPAGGPPHATDLERGRRDGTLGDFKDFVRLTQHFDVLHTINPIVEPQDVPLPIRHLEVTRAQLMLADKIPFVYSRGRAKVSDSLEMVRISHGVDPDEFVSTPRCFTVINTNSPRQIDAPMCLGLIQFAEMNQVAVVTPFTLAGAMAPVTLAGALTLQHAEALAAISLSQTVRPGAPVVYGAFTSNVDMRSGSPTFGTPEAVKAAYSSGQLARHVGLPWRSSAVSTANTPDAQAGYETMMSMMGAAHAGANMIIHAAGWQESGLAASYEKFILDVEIAQMWAEMFQPLVVSESEIGLDAIDTVEPGGHFFGSPHTLTRFENAFYEPIVFGRQNFEQWVEEGSRTAASRATPIWKGILQGFEAPVIADAIAAEIDDYVARRVAEGGVSPEA